MRFSVRPLSAADAMQTRQSQPVAAADPQEGTATTTACSSDAEERGMSGQALLERDTLFDRLDKNRDGFMSVDELCEWTSKLGHPLSPKGVHRLVTEFDKDRDGRLDFGEFMALQHILLDGEEGAEQEQHVEEEAFKVFDKDGNGLISPVELSVTLSELGLLGRNTSLSRVSSMIRKVDRDGDGEISLKVDRDGDGEISLAEFKTMMNKTK